jgi:hypothetical protein
MTSLSFKTVSIFTILLCLIGEIITPAHSISVAQSGSSSNLSRLPIAFPAQSTEITTYFNDIARPEDFVAIPPNFLQLLPNIKTGQPIVSFASWEAAVKVIPQLSTQFEWVLYDPEHWANTPDSEQQNLPTTVQNAAAFLHARNLRLFIAPDRKFADEYLDVLAPSTDALLLQGQRLQNNPDIFASWILEKIKIARTNNPKILIYVQVGANQGTPEEMMRAIQTVSDQIDGIAIWSTPSTLDTLKSFISLLRPPVPELTIVTTPNNIPNIESETPANTSVSLTSTPTLAPAPIGQRFLSERLVLIFLGLMVIFLAVLSAILAINLWKHRSRSG